MSSMATNPYPTLVPVSQQLAKNPVLPEHPLGAYTDSEYEAQNAILRSDIMQQYNDVLKQLGYSTPEGGFIQGSVE